jgi:hypothetical protein
MKKIFVFDFLCLPLYTSTQHQIYQPANPLLKYKNQLRKAASRFFLCIVAQPPSMLAPWQLFFLLYRLDYFLAILNYFKGVNISVFF